MCPLRAALHEHANRYDDDDYDDDDLNDGSDHGALQVHAPFGTDVTAVRSIGLLSEDVNECCGKTNYKEGFGCVDSVASLRDHVERGR